MIIRMKYYNQFSLLNKILLILIGVANGFISNIIIGSFIQYAWYVSVYLIAGGFVITYFISLIDDYQKAKKRYLDISGC